MKRLFMIIAIVALALSGCGDAVEIEEIEAEPNQTSAQITERANSDEYEINQTLSDWVLGTEYGIEEVRLNIEEKTLEIVISDDDYNKLADYDQDDIVNGLNDILIAYKISDGFVTYFSNGEMLESRVNEAPTSGHEVEPTQEESGPQIETVSETVNLMFIHHSVGENWLNAGLNEMLNENNFHVADTYYGWREMGDRTDTSDWPDWFNDEVMPTVYKELGNMTGHNTIEPATSENTIIMFKSCYPNSDVGNSIEDEKQIYLSLLSYFAEHTDKMFVLITPPPMQRISHPEKTRELANWLVSEDGWRKDYDGNNLFVFDFYNVLTAEDNHHMLVDGEEAHIVNDGSNTLYYDSAGDDHPNDEGSLKAAKEFVPLLIYWYQIFEG